MPTDGAYGNSPFILPNSAELHGNRGYRAGTHPDHLLQVVTLCVSSLTAAHSERESV